MLTESASDFVTDFVSESDTLMLSESDLLSCLVNVIVSEMLIESESDFVIILTNLMLSENSTETASIFVTNMFLVTYKLKSEERGIDSVFKFQMV